MQNTVYTTVHSIRYASMRVYAKVSSEQKFTTAGEYGPVHYIITSIT